MEIQPGDILGFSGSGFLAGAISIGTGSWPGRGLIHVGLACEFLRAELDWWGIPHVADLPAGGLYLLESTSLSPSPCAIQGKHVHGVQAHPLSVIGPAWLYRLTKPLDRIQRAALREWGAKRLGTKYDWVAAADARHTVLAALARRWLRKGSDPSKVYCMELVGEGLGQCGAVPLDEARRVAGLSPNAGVRWAVRSGIVGPGERVK